MTEHRGPSPENREVERAIFVRLLPRHYERRTSLHAALKHIEPARLQAALERLQQQGVVDTLTAARSVSRRAHSTLTTWG